MRQGKNVTFSDNSCMIRLYKQNYEVTTVRLVNVQELQEGMILAQDVYSDEDSIIVPEKVELKSKTIKALQDFGIEKVYIVGEPAVDREEQELLRDVAIAQGIPQTKPTIHPELQENAIHNLEDIFVLAQKDELTQQNATHLVKELDSVVDQLVETLMHDRDSLVNIADLKSYDDYTFHHSLAVAVLSLAIGQSLGFAPKELNLLGRTAMLHDIGKTAIPIEIINKPSKLDPDEFITIKTHSPEGYDYLVKGNIGEKSLLEGVLYHHERIDGTGYPKGLSGEDIPLLSRIICVADVYDALTSNRPYREPMQPAAAVEYIMGNVGLIFDYDIVMAFLKKLELYPVGSHIELSNSQTAVVMNNEYSMRPTVKVLDTGQVLDLYHDRDCLSLTIKRIVSDKEALA